MNYEERYNQALKVIESLYNVVKYQSSSDALLASQIIEKEFPELKESEDERIMKELITHCRYTRCVTEEWAERIAKWIAWLEKQCEKKSADSYCQERTRRTNP